MYTAFVFFEEEKKRKFSFDVWPFCLGAHEKEFPVKCQNPIRFSRFTRSDNNNNDDNRSNHETGSFAKQPNEQVCAGMRAGHRQLLLEVRRGGADALLREAQLHRRIFRTRRVLAGY